LTGVAEFLLELAPCKEGACEVVLPYDKVLIAGRLGMKPESQSRAFVRLRDQGVTIRQNNAVIEDVTALRAFAEEDPAAAWAIWPGGANRSGVMLCGSVA